VGLLSTGGYSGIISASINGSTTVEVAEDGLVLLGPTINTLSISAYPFSSGGDWFLGASCPSSAQVQIPWVQKYDCYNDIVYFIPKTGAKASITGNSLNGVDLACDPNVVTASFEASATNGPTTVYITNDRRDGFNLRYTGSPIPVESASSLPYNITLGTHSYTCYLQSFNISVAPPQPATCSYSFVFTN
jgi:hypothetical protein